MASMPWFRVYSEILDDKKIKRIVRTTGYSKALIIGTWICLLALANNADERGRLTISEDMPYKLDDLEDETGLERSMLMTILDQFVKMGMVITGGIDQAYEINKWNKRQFKSDYSTERVREFREKQDETLQKRCKSVVDTESDTDTDSNTDINSTGEPPENNPDIEQDKSFVQFRKVWEQEGKSMVAKYIEFAKMVSEFEKVGVTPEIYRQAIQEQKRSTYPVENPMSVKKWAIGIVRERDKPQKQYQSKSAPETMDEHNDRATKEVLAEFTKGKFDAKGNRI